jgi:hypothetical protein
MPFYRDRLGQKEGVYRKYGLKVRIIRAKKVGDLKQPLLDLIREGE